LFIVKIDFTMKRKVYHSEVDQLIEIGTYIYKQLGHGFQDHVYRDVMELELDLRNIPYIREEVYQNKEAVENVNFVCFDKIIVDLNTHSYLTDEQEDLFLNKLEELDSPIGLLFNFGHENLQFIKVGDQVVCSE